MRRKGNEKRAARAGNCEKKREGRGLVGYEQLNWSGGRGQMEVEVVGEGPRKDRALKWYDRICKEERPSAKIQKREIEGEKRTRRRRAKREQQQNKERETAKGNKVKEEKEGR